MRHCYVGFAALCRLMTELFTRDSSMFFEQVFEVLIGFLHCLNCLARENHLLQFDVKMAKVLNLELELRSFTL